MMHAKTSRLVVLQLVWLREHDGKEMTRVTEAASSDELLTELQQELRRQELLAENRDADIAEVFACRFCRCILWVLLQLSFLLLSSRTEHSSATQPVVRYLCSKIVVTHKLCAF